MHLRTLLFIALAAASVGAQDPADTTNVDPGTAVDQPTSPSDQPTETVVVEDPPETQSPEPQPTEASPTAEESAPANLATTDNAPGPKPTSSTDLPFIPGFNTDKCPPGSQDKLKACYAALDQAWSKLSADCKTSEINFEMSLVGTVTAPTNFTSFPMPPCSCPAYLNYVTCTAGFCPEGANAFKALFPESCKAVGASAVTTKPINVGSIATSTTSTPSSALPGMRMAVNGGAASMAAAAALFLAFL
ncbi:hypothetical protein HDU97_007789 [Phlyctochytrium planicorne]|nr:hypothetical protein HDU97_007789 [Phlyctochytrium planicorne]